MTYPSQDQLNTLHATLKEEAAQYELAANKLVEKKCILLSNDPAGLPRLDQELLLLAQKTRQLERSRIEQMRDLGHGDLSLRQFIGTLDPRRGKPFLDARTRLLKAVDEVSTLNRHNKELIQLSMQWIQDSVEVIAGLITPEGASYNAQGNKSRQPGQVHEPAPQSTVIHDA